MTLAIFPSYKSLIIAAAVKDLLIGSF